MSDESVKHSHSLNCSGLIFREKLALLASLYLKYWFWVILLVILSILWEKKEKIVALSREHESRKEKNVPSSFCI